MSGLRAVALALWVLGVLLFLTWFWTTQPLVLPRRAVGNARADPARLERDVHRIVERFHPRDFSHPDNLARAATFLAAEFSEAGAEVRDQPFSAGSATYRNVVASFGPRTREVVVVGAHYDTHGELPGADDNASGVAGLLELARVLPKSDLSIRVELVAYALEELPYFGTREMGSAVHARSLRDSGARLRAMLCLEMIASFSSEPNSQKFPFPMLRLFYPNRGNFIAVVGRVRDGPLVRRVKGSMRAGTDLPVHSIDAPRSLPGVDLSDHSSYWDLGYPAVMITDTAFYRNEGYHTEQDTPETLDYSSLAKVVDGVARAVRDLARGSGEKKNLQGTRSGRHSRSQPIRVPPERCSRRLDGDSRADLHQVSPAATRVDDCTRYNRSSALPSLEVVMALRKSLASWGIAISLFTCGVLLAALMQHSEATIPIPVPGEKTPLAKLEYRARFVASIDAVTLELASSDTADPVVAR